MTRTCVGCRRRGPKESFVRICRAPDGPADIDPDGTAPGRGAYVCPDVRCFEQAVRKGRLAGALRTVVGAEDIARMAGALREPRVRERRRRRTVEGERSRGAQ